MQPISFVTRRTDRKVLLALLTPEMIIVQANDSAGMMLIAAVRANPCDLQSGDTGASFAGHGQQNNKRRQEKR